MYHYARHVPNQPAFEVSIFFIVVWFVFESGHLNLLHIFVLTVPTVSETSEHTVLQKVSRLLLSWQASGSRACIPKLSTLRTNFSCQGNTRVVFSTLLFAGTTISAWMAAKYSLLVWRNWQLLQSWMSGAFLSRFECIWVEVKYSAAICSSFGFQTRFRYQQCVVC